MSEQISETTRFDKILGAVPRLNKVEKCFFSSHDRYSAIELDRVYGADELIVTRLAVTPEQVREMRLPTAPPKTTDRRSFSGQTTQAEAIPPRRLREIVTEAIEDRLDREAYDDVLAEETEIRESLAERLEDL